ncbi:hypothetical protein Dsin_015001 [Dipteronia sinensis]|uniref:Cyclic nucleotide-binding domain-containing protein n=1 Tax=Dipteronia sinensis TaxID=43782 RepID=A0AAE0EAF1_9ROSI|nr:hypothetical protein Dsin_015001 [Dipteronia sinensis]
MEREETRKRGETATDAREVMSIKVATKKWKEKKREKEEKQQQMLEKWFPFTKLSERQQKCIKEHQLKNKWKQKGDVDVENLLNNLPTDLGNYIKRELCLHLLQNAGSFRLWSEVSLVQLCDCLKPVVYAKRANIVRKGKPIDEMSIVLQGKLCTFSSKILALRAMFLVITEKGSFERR